MNENYSSRDKHHFLYINCIERKKDSAKSCPILATPWTVARQTTLSMGFPRQEYRSGLPFPSPMDVPDPGIKPLSHKSLASPALAGRFFATLPPGKPMAE